VGNEPLALTVKQRNFILNFSMPFVADVQAMARQLEGAWPALADKAGLSYDVFRDVVTGNPADQRIGRVLAVFAAITHQDMPKGAPSKAVSVPRRSKTDEPTWFQAIRTAYPKRAGDQGWQRALSACLARAKEGHTFDEMMSGARRYAAFVQATGKEGTEYVKQAATFFGPGKPFLLPWDPPAAAQTAYDRIAAANAPSGRVFDHE
jgi:hypothetical protein